MLITEDDICIREFLSDCSQASIFIMNWYLSFSTDNSVISCDDDSHIACELSRCREVILVSRMENIKCTETHHMVKYLFSERIIE